MQRKFVLAALAGAFALAGLVTWLSAPRAAQPPADANGLIKPPASQLPIGQVVLFNSGVGYFQREGEVDGNARIDLTFPITDVNDLLKSLVLQDLGGGKVSTISYDSQEPVERTLRSF